MKVFATATILFLGASTVQAQVTVGVGGGSWGYGGGSGYGMGWGWGYGYGTGNSGVIVAGSGYGLYTAGPLYGWGGGGSAVATGVVAPDLTRAWGPWGYPRPGPVRRGRFRPVPGDAPPPSAEAWMPEARPASSAMDEGRRRFRAGDYRGALDQFREAVVADGRDGVAEAHFALGLTVTGDHRNADKALRSALTHGYSGPIDLASMGRDGRELQKLAILLSKAPEGALTASWALAGVGKPERLEALAAKDPDAKRLLAPGK